MAGYQVADIRNVALVGHSSAGKTTLGEAILFKAGVTTRLGSVEDGTSMLDHDEEARERKHSVESTVFYVEHGGRLLNFIDTPGMPDYCGQAIAALAGVDTACVVISAASGLGVNTRKMFQAAREYGLGCMIVVTRLDAENARLDELLGVIRESFGPQCRPVNLPADGGRRVIDLLRGSSGTADILDVAAAHTELVEAIVETDEALLEEYMESGSVAVEKLPPAARRAVASGRLIPVAFVSAVRGTGVAEFLDAVAELTPSPLEGTARTLVIGEGEAAQEEKVAADPDDDFCGLVFKITSDPRSNIKYSVARVLRGSLRPDSSVFVSGDRKGQRPGHLFRLRGDQHAEIEAASCGDIVAFAKLDFRIGATLFAKPQDGQIRMPKFPTPMFALALEPKSRADVEKVSGALHRFAEEDPCFQYYRDTETNELVMQGLGDQHLNVIRSKMKRYFKLEVETKAPKIPYRETVSASVKYVEYTHKKQTGGAGQYAKVVIDLEPNERGKGYEFIDKIFGGVIDQAFRPSVDKGIRDQMRKGVIAGFPVVDVKVSLVDGKTHPVDSKDIAFQIAGREAFKKAFLQSKPILLEPIMNIEITVPTEYVGDIARDLAGKRGQVLGQEVLPGGQVCIRGVVPLAEVLTYSSQLKSATGGQGSYAMELSHYDVVPPNIQQQIAASHKAAAQEEKE